MTPLVGFVAPSGTGKTTLLEAVIRSLAARGLRVGALKHDAHRLELDRPGKDTWRFRQAGAWRAIIVGDAQLAVFSAVDGPVTIGGVAADWLAEADLVIVEGFRRSGIPLIRVHREAAGADPSWSAPEAPIAWVSDAPQDVDVPVLPLDGDAVADFLVARFVGARAVEAVTLVIPVGRDEDRAAAAAIARGWEGAVRVVRAPGVAPIDGLVDAVDVRPDVGPLGALITGLVLADTPRVALVGARHAGDLHVLPRLLAARGDVAVPVRGGHHEPLLAVYGHRCLPAIQAALRSGEPKMDGWWGQVRVTRVPW